MKDFSWAPYARSLREPFSYGARTVSLREGIVLRARQFESFVYAEASPLPGHSRDTLMDCVAWLKGERMLPAPPALAWGLASLENLRRMEASRLLYPVRSSALLRWQGNVRTQSNLQELHARGFRVFKLKVPSGSVSEAALFIAAAPGDSTFRLDANQAFNAADFADLTCHWPSIRDRVEYVEEPGAEWESSCVALGIPYAADESAGDPALWTKLFSRPSAPDTLVAKPMVNGPVDRWPATNLVFGSALEVEPGRRALIAWLGSDPQRVKKAAGLATGSLLRESHLLDLPRYDHIPEITGAERLWLNSLVWREFKS